MVGSRGMVMGEEWVAQCKEGTCDGDCSCKWERSKVAWQSCKQKKREWTCKLFYTNGYACGWAVRWTLEDNWACPKNEDKTK